MLQVEYSSLLHIAETYELIFLNFENENEKRYSEISAFISS